MALFGSNEEASSSKKTVRPTVVRTQNVAKEIASIAKSFNVKAESLDFNLLDVQTYTRMNDGTKETEWETIDEGQLYELDDETALLNKNFQIKQTYEIEVFSSHTVDEPSFIDLKLAVGANASRCKVYLSIAAGSALKYTKRLEVDFKTLINKKKIRAGILIYIFDEMVDDVVSKVTARARVEDILNFEKSETILIAEGFEPTETTNDKLVMHYEENEEVDDNAKVDYASRGFIQSVKQDELLIEYIKPKLGIPGRNCRGEFMEPSEPVISNEVAFEVNETIKKVETDESIQFIAKENGYIALDGKTYLIKTDMDVGEISFKTTGSIMSGVDSDVSLSVKESDVEKDAIGTGMHVEVTEIDIEGNVGSNAQVTAIKASVGGQTHGTSIVKADKLDINIHKGKALGKNIKITRLEHGVVNGDKVSIQQASGGHIKAKEIDIEICGSHVTATALKRIEIKKLQGDENVFIIDPLLNKSVQKDLSNNEDSIKNIETSLKDLDKKVKHHAKLVQDGESTFLDIKKRLIHYKKNGVKMPGSFMKKYKQYTGLQEQLKDLKQEYTIKKDQLNLHTAKTESFQDNILEARIINRDRWVGYNEIKFKLVEPPIELVYKPHEGSMDKVFGLVEVDEGMYEIQVLAE